MTELGFTQSKDWVKTLDKNFKKLSQQSSDGNISLGDGWTGINNDANVVHAFPLPNGTVLKMLELNIQNSVKANQSYNSIVTLPDGFISGISRPVGVSVSLEHNGHFQGTMKFWFANRNHLGGTYSCLDGEAGPYDFHLRATILYY